MSKVLDFANLNKLETKVRNIYFRKAKARKELLQAIREAREDVEKWGWRACWKAYLYGTLDRLCYDEKLLTAKERKELVNFISSLKESFEEETGKNYTVEGLK